MRFGVLGPLLVDDGAGGARPVAGARQRVLLAALLLRANRVVSAEELARVVWEGSPPPGQAALRTQVMRLRRALGGEAAARIVTRDPGYLISLDEDEFDAALFEALCREAGDAVRAGQWREAAEDCGRALELWRADALRDVDSAILREECGTHLEQLRLQALEWRIEADLNLGRHARLVPELRDLAQRHPLREHTHAQLMLALYRCGRAAEALEAYQEARRTLVGELGIEPGPELQALHARILAGDAALMTPPPEPSPRAAQRVVPQQLPAAVRHFTGRRTETDALLALVAQSAPACGTVVISAIDGMAGIGKTTLAVNVSHLLAERFPDGQLFVDLHGYTHGLAPREPADVLAAVLQAYGVAPRRIPADPEARAALYRDHLAGTRTLILLDNAADEAQVRPLLPGSSGCMVLVTSRRRLKALDDAYALPLDILTMPDAVALLREVAGLGDAAADDSLLEEIAQLCGRLPLALRIVASVLRHRPAWTAGHLAAKLRAAASDLAPFSDGHRNLSALFDLSYQSLDEDRRLLFRRLGLVPGPDVDAHAAATLLDARPSDTEELLQDLVDHNLLSEREPGRYRLHDLLRRYARALAGHDPADQSGAAVQRLLDYYQHAAVRADALISRHPRPGAGAEAARQSPLRAPDLPDAGRARAWLRAERANLIACIEYAAAEALDERTVAMSAGVAALLLSDGPWSEALATHAAAAAAAERLGDHVGRAHALIDAGNVRRVSGDYEGAVGDLEAALELFEDLRDQAGEARALAALGPVRQMSGDCRGAIRDLERGLTLVRGLGDRAGEAGVLTYLGTVRFVTGDYPGGIHDLETALKLFRELDDRAGRAHALTDLGPVRQITGDYPGALRDLEEALELYRGLGNRHGESVALTELGGVRRMTGDYPGAVRDLETALDLCRTLGNRNGQAFALGGLGAVRRMTGDHPGALHALETALDLFRQIGSRGNEAWALNLYAAVFVATGEFERARALHGDALRLALAVGMPDEEALALEGIGECDLRAGRADEGAAHLSRALAIFRRLGLPDAERVGARLAGLGAPDL